MTERVGELPVEPRLFSYLEKYATDLGKGQVGTDDPISEELVTFLEHFFQQFLESEADLEITGIDSESKAAVIARRYQLPRDPHVDTKRRLMVSFQELCDIWPDISQASYWRSDLLFQRFHLIYLPRLLRRIEEWAEASECTEIADAASAAAQMFTPAIQAAMTGDGEDERKAPQPGEESENRKELVRLVELDYERTTDFISGLTQREAGIRGFAVTIWTATLGLAFNRSIWQLGALAIVAALAFLLLDGYYSALYMQAQRRAGELEGISASYYASLSNPNDQDSDVDMLYQLDQYRFGLYRSLEAFRLRDLLTVRKRMIFRFFYPLLIAGAILATVLIALQPPK